MKSETKSEVKSETKSEVKSGMKSTLFLIDGSSQMYRAYHAIRGLTGPDGRSTNAVYGFTTMLRKLITEQQPEFIAASFDVAAKTFRSDLAADYKANRAPMPPDLAEQIPWVHRACEALGVPILTYEGYEADDVIGTITERAVTEGFEVAIVTGDKDFFQLVRNGVKVYNPRDEGTWFDVEGVRQKFGVAPEQVVDVLALTGDTIDNIKGVPGIGEKGARDLISTFGSLDTLLAGAERVTQKKYREGLMAHAETARQSRELARIRTDVPLTFDLQAFRYPGSSREKCFELFSMLGFRSLVMEFAPTAETVATDYQVVGTEEALAGLVKELRGAGRLAFRILPSEPNAMRASIVGIAFSTAPRRAWYVPLGSEESPAAGSLLGGLERGETPQVSVEQALSALGPVFADAAIGKIGHDLKFDIVILERHGVTVAGLEFDTMLASYVLDATRSSHPLEETSLEHLAYKALTEEDVCGRGPKAMRPADLPVASMLNYAGERADLAWQLAERLRPALDADHLSPVFERLEMPLIPVLVDLERAGIRLDAAVLAAQSQHIERELATRYDQIVGLAGEPFNINSPRQLSEILFDKLKLPALKRTGKTRVASTAVEVLEELALVHDLPRYVLEWRALHKLKSTYIDALPQLVDRATGRVHTSFNQAVAATGRLSSSDPNLQNIPIRTELGREIRKAFVADRGDLLISADYSQIELRVLAHLSQDEVLMAAFKRGDDIHDQTALKVFGADSGLSPHELRRRAKIVNYALLYGKTAFTLARDIGVSQQAAQEFIDNYFAGFPAVRQFIDRTLESARASGEVKTMFGRRRLVPELTSRNGQIRAAAERVTVNLPIQGTAADILKLAMIDIHRELKRRRTGGQPLARMILTVHDELLFEAQAGLAEEAADLVRERMQNAVTLAVPLTVDVGIGENWKEAKG
jgi:DNA polymerase-1